MSIPSYLQSYKIVGFHLTFSNILNAIMLPVLPSVLSSHPSSHIHPPLPITCEWCRQVWLGTDDSLASTSSASLTGCDITAGSINFFGHAAALYSLMVQELYMFIYIPKHLGILHNRKYLYLH